MNTNDIQSKVSKADATQEMITAQNSNNQGNRLFGTFTEEEMRNIVYNSEQDFIKPNYVINYLKQAEHILDKARMSDENRNFIKGAFQMMAGFGQWNTKEKYEFILQSNDPYDIRQMLEDGDEEDAIEALIYEVGFLAGDLQNDEQYWFDEYEVGEAKEALEEFYSIVQEYNLEEKIYEDREWGWVLDDVKKVLAA